MKKRTLFKIYLLTVLVLITASLRADDTTAVKPRLLVDVAYYLSNNEIPYVTVLTRHKIEKKFTAVKDMVVKVYLNEVSDANMLGTVTTDKDGKGVLYFPPSIKPVWDSISEFTLIAETVANKNEESISNEITLTKAKIEIVTTSEEDVKNVEVRIMEKRGAEWVPAGETETKVIVKRMAGNLSVGEEEFYSTDTTGLATVEFLRSGIPGDAKGDIVLVAKTEDNELYGNISIEKKVNWGVASAPVNTFDKRTLFATRDKAPYWLIILAGGIVISVWSVIFYLVTLLWKIRSHGRSDLKSTPKENPVLINS